MTNGATALLETLRNAGVDTCFINPGTSEMHFVSALDDSDMRCVLALFEGVATGAADGYARMAQKPAATLLHLGCGLGNGVANLHNARKARVPMVNIVGDHATYHTKFDAQLQSDIETVARNVSTWVRTTKSVHNLAKDTAEAVAVAIGPQEQIATLILPADVSWGEGAVPVSPQPRTAPPQADSNVVEEIARVLRSGEKTAILLGRRVLLEQGLVAAARIAEKTGASVLCEVFPTRLERGAGLPAVERLAYFAELASVQLAGYKHLVLIDAKAPVSFFAYPGKKSYLVPDGCSVHTLVTPEQDAIGSIEQLVRAVGADRVKPKLQASSRPELPTGKLTGPKVCQAVGALLPANAIISDEAQTSGVKLGAFTAGAPRHDVLTLTGGAIGQGLPVALGAAVAEPNRPVLALVGDGSAMYTVQALWTIVREQLNVTTVILNNRAYSILNIELERVGAEEPGPKARAQFDLNTPPLDFVKLADGMGMSARRASTAEEFNAALEQAFSTPGPHLIDAIVPSEFDGLKLRALPMGLEVLQRMPSPLAKSIKKKLGL
ncbi:MAG: acetolactate synthase large subunit [Myxococcales bacterium]|nr:acetolactate synthase large subunit [Myxococcales bacterium]MCB9628861.1 acetolactate synthase large subunit [Sandaracinaceae bacterium]